jgi:hypothetical protein
MGDPKNLMSSFSDHDGKIGMSASSVVSRIFAESF